MDNSQQPRKFVKAQRKGIAINKKKDTSPSTTELTDEETLRRFQSHATGKNNTLDEEVLGTEAMIKSNDEIIQACIKSKLKPLSIFNDRPNYAKQFNTSEPNFNKLNKQLLEIFRSYQRTKNTNQDNDNNNNINDEGENELTRINLATWITKIFTGIKIQLYLTAIAIDCIDYDKLYILTKLSTISPFGVVICMHIPSSSLPNKNQLQQDAKKINRNRTTTSISESFRIILKENWEDQLKMTALIGFDNLYELIVIPYNYVYAPVILIEKTFLPTIQCNT